MKDEKGPDEKVPNADLYSHPTYGCGHTFVTGMDATDTGMGLEFHIEDWEAVFENALGVPTNWDQDIDFSDQGLKPREERRVIFARYIPDYPLLARMCERNGYVIYAENELSALRRECEQAQQKARDPASVLGFQKIIFAAELAVAAPGNLRFGLRLAPS